MRVRRKKISPILRSNINKKMIQLNRILYELQSASTNFQFQKEFLNNFFNPRIDNAINAYRDHINNMQKVALEDYDFIIDRTDRFYQRKYQNLLKSYSNDIDSLRNETISIISNLDQEKQNALQTTTSLKNRISTFENESQTEIDNYLQRFKSTVNKIKRDGEIKLKTEITNLRSKEQKFIRDSEQKQKKMQEDHFLLLELIKSGYVSPQLNIQTIRSKIKEIKKCMHGYKSNLKSLQTYAMQQLSVNRNKTNQLIKEIIFLINKNKNEQNSIQKVFDTINNEFNESIRQLKTNFDLIKQSYSKEIEQKMNDLNELKIQLQKKLDDYKNGLSQNNIDDEQQISMLQKSLDESLQSLIASLEKEKNDINQKVELFLNQIESIQKEHEESIQKLKDQLETLKKQHQLEIIELQSFFDAEKAEALKKFEKEISEVKEKMKNMSNEGQQTEAEARSTILELEDQKQKLIETHQLQISEHDLNFSEILNTIEKETSEKVKNLSDQIESMLHNHEKSLEAEISEIQLNNAKKKSDFLRTIEKQYEIEMNLIREAGYSKSEYDTLLKNYQDLHLRLLEQSKQMVPFVVSSDTFSNMNLVINDLQKELQDHEIMVSSRKRCLNLEWQTKLEQQNKVISNLLQKHQNCHARNQIIQSLKNQIQKVVKLKEDTIFELNNELSKLMVTKEIKLDSYEGEEDEDIRQLKSELNDSLQNSEGKISMCLQNSERLKKETSNKFSVEIRSINEQIRNVLQLIQKQNLSFENQMNDLNISFDLNKANYKKSYEESVNYFLNVFDNMKRDFLETEHLLRTKLKEQSFQNSRNFDFYRSIENDEHKKLTKSLIEIEEKNKEFLQNRQKVKDDLSAKIVELKSKRDFLLRKAAEPRSELNENDRTERLEKHLKIITNKLNMALQDLVEYKNLYMSQEKKINQNFNGMPEIGTYKKKHNCVNYDVI